ncbi:MAG: DUF192 domain-containing protein [Pseudomonas sp.]
MARKPAILAASLIVVGLGFAVLLLGRRDQAEVQQAADTPASSDSAQPSRPSAQVKPSDFRYATVAVQIGDSQYSLDIADSAAKKSLGLGQRDSLPAGRGMIFIYDQPGDLCFWMKGMRISIDIIWLDAAKKVVKIEPSLSPDTYPQTYCPDKPSQYVVELPAGAAAVAGLRVGDTLLIDI